LTSPERGILKKPVDVPSDAFPVGTGSLQTARRNTTPIMTMLRPSSAIGLLATVLLFSAPPARAVVPDYKLGDVAAEDVVTPVRLQVLNPEATEALKERIAREVPYVVLRTGTSAAEAERELRASVDETRAAYLAACKSMLARRTPASGVVESDPFASITRDFAHTAPKNFPLTRFAEMWQRGGGDESLVNGMVLALREVMGQTIVNDKVGSPLPVNQPVRVVNVAQSTDSPSLEEIENSGVSIQAKSIISPWRAHRLVETSFPAGQGDLGKFAAEFVRVNAAPAPDLTEILRAKRMEGLAVNDTYETADVVVKKGRIIDRKALGALAALREKSLIGTLQTKLEQERTVAGRITQQTIWIVAGLAVMCIVLVLIFRRLRPRPGSALVPVAAGFQPLSGGDDRQALPGESGGDEAWRSRAIAAEEQAARAREAIRSGAMDMMREKVFQTLSSQRADLLSAQQRAEAEMRELEQRLEQLHTPLQERIAAYEKRIEELEQDLAAKGEENRELIGARISVAKQQLNAERSRFGAN